MRLVLPYPVSANAYWQSFVPKGQTRAIVHLSTEAKRYKRDVAWIAKQAGIRNPTDRPVEIGSIILIPRAYRLRIDPKTLDRVQVKNSTVMDLDNCIKVTLDALKGIAYVDDAQIKRIRGPIEYSEPDGQGGLVIEIEEFIPPIPPLFSDAATA